jgi:hypothetical protein
LNPADQPTFFLSLLPLCHPLLQSLHHPAPQSYAVASLLLTLLPSIPLLVVLSLPHGLSTPSTRYLFWGGSAIACFLIGRLRVAGELLNIFWWLKPRTQAKKTGAAWCSAVQYKPGYGGQ